MYYNTICVPDTYFHEKFGEHIKVKAFRGKFVIPMYVYKEHEENDTLPDMGNVLFTEDLNLSLF